MMKINGLIFAVVLILATVMVKSLQLAYEDASTLSGSTVDSVAAQAAPTPTAAQEQKIFNFSYYLLDKEREQVFLEGKEGIIPGERQLPLTVSSPSGKIFPETAPAFTYQAEFGQIFSQEQKVDLKQNVVLVSEQDDLRGQHAIYDVVKKYFYVTGEVKAIHLDSLRGQKLFVDSDEAEAFIEQEHYIFRGRVSGKIERQRTFESPVFYRAHQADAQIRENMIYLTGPVWVQQNRFEAEGLRGEIFLENYNKKLKYYGLYDDVRLRQNPLPGQKVPVKLAQGEKLDGFMAEKKVVLTGNPRLFQGTSTVRGTEITFFENTDVVEAINSDSTIDLQSGR